MSSGQYFEADPSVETAPSTVHLSLPDWEADLSADRGVFSSGRVDPGTLALLRAIPEPPQAATLLDLGCGYGPIACTLAHRAPAADVWALDVNRRALALTAANAARLGLERVRAVEAADVPAGLRFDRLYSNPPIHVGKEVLHGMLATWLARLAPGGQAWLVVHKHLGGDSLATWLAAHGWPTARAASKQGYRILTVSAAAGERPLATRDQARPT